jgi:2-polyprenyl-6-methoxyphenol hydroxylase-like FAD-dependent oxidoreductase
MRPLEIAVAGCGPAGLAAGLLLQRDGHRVTLYDRFETPQPIGSGLMIQPTGQAVLAAMGLEEELIARGARIDRLIGSAGTRTVLDVRYSALRGDRCGIGIHRASLFALLHEAAHASGIRFVTGHEITGCEKRGDGRLLTFATRDVSRPYQLVVDALGARSRLRGETGRPLAYGALWASLDWPADAGFDAHALQQRYRAASVMAGVLPIGTPPGAAGPQAAFFWSLRADRLEAWRAAGLNPWKSEVRALWPETAVLLDQIADPDQLTFARYAHRTLPAPVEPGMIHIGDAWHATSPQLGQGANMALLDAWALATALREDDQLARPLARAAALRRRHVRLYQALSLLLTPVYQSDGRVVPWLRDWLVGSVSRMWPVPQIQAAMVSGLIGNPLKRLGL